MRPISCILAKQLFVRLAGDRQAEQLLEFAHGILVWTRRLLPSISTLSLPNARRPGLNPHDLGRRQIRHRRASAAALCSALAETFWHCGLFFGLVLAFWPEQQCSPWFRWHYRPPARPRYPCRPSPCDRRRWRRECPCRKCRQQCRCRSRAPAVSAAAWPLPDRRRAPAPGRH